MRKIFPKVKKGQIVWGEGGGRESYGIFLLFVTFFLWLPKSNPSNLISISYDFLPTKVALHFCNAIHQIQNCLRLNIGKVVHLPRPLHCLNLAKWCYSVCPQGHVKNYLLSAQARMQPGRSVLLLISSFQNIP